MISYRKALTLMKEKGLTSYKIRKQKIIPESTLQKIRDNKPITTETLSTLCRVLGCQPGDLMEYIPDLDVQDEPMEDKNE